MKRMFLCIALIWTTSAFAATNLSGNNGYFASVGVGIAPIYIEEIVAQDTLAGGAEVLAFHSSERIGMVFRDVYSIYALAEHNWYVDAESNIYATGLTGIGTTYFPPGFFDTFFLAGVGIANKAVFGENTFSGGSGYLVGFGRPINKRLSFEASYSVLSLKSIAMPFANGEAESISSVQFNLTYHWY